MSQEVTAPQEEDFSQNMRYKTTANTDTGQTGGAEGAAGTGLMNADLHVESRYSFLFKNLDDTAEYPPENVTNCISMQVLKTFSTLIRKRTQTSDLANTKQFW